jgi:hypothetical protein
MNNWAKLKVPSFGERIVGFSIPQEGEVLVVGYEGIHLLNIDSDSTVEIDTTVSEDDIYDPDTGIVRYKNKEYKIIGLHGGEPITDGFDGEELLLDEDSETLFIRRNQEIIFSYKYENFSGDWTAATFSPDGRFIILGCPYIFDFLVLRRD